LPCCTQLSKNNDKFSSIDCNSQNILTLVNVNLKLLLVHRQQPSFNVASQEWKQTLKLKSIYNRAICTPHWHFIQRAVRFKTSNCKTLLDVQKSQSHTVWSYAPMALWPQPSNQASGWARLFKAKLVCFHVDDQNSNITQYIVCAYGDCLIRILCQMIANKGQKIVFYVLIR
jgi:hypothetical protein